MVRKVVIVAILAVAVIGVLVLKHRGDDRAEARVIPAPTDDVALPTLIDFGADKCTSCKLMQPILTRMGQSYTGRMTVQFVDVWKDPEAAEGYDLRMIPTQIFFAPDGSELYRHEGFLSEEDILMKWKTLGFEFESVEGR